MGKLAVISVWVKLIDHHHPIFFFLSFIWNVLQCILFHQPNLKWQWKFFSAVCSSALSCHSSQAHRVFTQTDDLWVNVLLQKMVSRLFVHTARSPLSSIVTKQPPINWSFPLMSEAEASVMLRQLCTFGQVWRSWQTNSCTKIHCDIRHINWTKKICIPQITCSAFYVNLSLFGQL